MLIDLKALIGARLMLHQTKVLLDHAFSERLAGQWRSAIDLCEMAMRKSIEEHSASDFIEVVLAMGHSYREMGETELAMEQYDLAYELAQLQENHSQSSRALNCVGILHQEHGDIDDAEAVYRHARNLAVASQDALATGNVHHNLGTLANIRGNLEEALESYKSGLRCYEEVEYERGIAGVLNNLGMLYIDLHELDAAEESLNRALDVCVKMGDAVTQAIVHINKTELAIARAELDAARASCDNAFEIFSRLGELSGKSEALKFYGIIYRETNKPYLAETHLREAVEIAATYKFPLQEAEAQRELALVLRAQGRNRESLEALNRSRVLFTSLQAKQDQADVSKRVTQLEQDFISLVQYWGESIEAKDRYTRGHCQRVADYACMIAVRSGMPSDVITWFRMGAFLHDVGKTEVPEEILNKPGRLTDDERTIIEQHTVIGDEMLASIEFPWEIRPMIRSHHERWDGRGYPDGLVGEEIPFTARILRIADIFDALTTTRSYREPLSPAQALQIMREDHGSFDPDLFAIFEAVFPDIEAEATRCRLQNSDSEKRSASALA